MDIGGLEVEIIHNGFNQQGEVILGFEAPRAVKIMRKEISKRNAKGFLM